MLPSKKQHVVITAKRIDVSVSYTPQMTVVSELISFNEATIQPRSTCCYTRTALRRRTDACFDHRLPVQSSPVQSTTRWSFLRVLSFGRHRGPSRSGPTPCHSMH